MEHADSVLRSASEATISILDKDLSETGLDELAARDTVKALNFPDHTLAIFDGSGELLAERPSRQPRPHSPAGSAHHQSRGKLASSPRCPCRGFISRGASFSAA